MRFGSRHSPGRGRFPVVSNPDLIINPPNGTSVRALETQWLMANVAAGTSVTWLVDGSSVGSSSAAFGGFAWTPGAAGTYSVQAQVGATKSRPISVTAVAEVTLDVANLSYVKAYFDAGAGKTVAGGRVSAWTNSSTTATFLPSYSQGTGSLQPWECWVRGRKALRIGTGNERMTGTTGAALAQPWHSIILARPTLSNGTNICAPGKFGTAGLQFDANASFYPRTVTAAAGASLVSTATLARSGPILIGGKFAGASGQVALNSTHKTGTNGTGTIASGLACAIGATTTPSQPMPGAIGDVIVAQGMTDGDWTTLENFELAKWRLDQPGATMLCVGDSITLGDGSTDGDGWRSLLSPYLEQYRIGGKWLDCIGPTEEAGFINDSHYASSGKSIQWMQTNLIPKLTAAFQPDVISVLIGTNNVRENGATWVAGTGAGSTYADLVTLLQSIATAVPGAVLILWTLPPLQDSTYEARAVALNANIPAALAASGLPGVVLDSRAALPTWNVTDQPDGVHPSDAGYSKILPLVIDAVRKATLL